MNEAQRAEQARNDWMKAVEQAGEIGSELFQPGSGYGDPEAKEQDLHRLNEARLHADRMYKVYLDIDRAASEAQAKRMQKSQRLLAIASFVLSAVVGASAIITSWIALYAK